MGCLDRIYNQLGSASEETMSAEQSRATLASLQRCGWLRFRLIELWHAHSGERPANKSLCRVTKHMDWECSINVLRKVATLSVLSVLLTIGVGFAEDHHDDHSGSGPAQGHYVRYDEWCQGAKINRAD